VLNPDPGGKIAVLFFYRSISKVGSYIFYYFLKRIIPGIFLTSSALKGVTNEINGGCRMPTIDGYWSGTVALGICLCLD